MRLARKPWWQQATALVTVSTGGVITGFNFVPGAATTMTSPASVPLHLLALEHAAQSGAAGDLAAGDSAGRVSSDAQLRAAIVNVARYYLQLAKTRTPAQMEALIWDNTSNDGADHGPSCAAFASLTLELAAQTVGLRSWVTGGTTYPWPMPAWADVRVDTNPASPDITSVVADAQAHGRWHPLGDGYQPQPGDWAVYDGHVEVVTSYSGGVLDTIGADSLPGLTVNAHSDGTPLAEQGIAGFVDNGNLQPAAGTRAAPKPGSAGQTSATATRSAPTASARPQGTSNVKVPSPAPTTAAIPGLPGAAALSGDGGIPAAGTAPGNGGGRTQEENAAASVPGLPAPPASTGTKDNPGTAMIPGASGTTGTARAQSASRTHTEAPTTRRAAAATPTASPQNARPTPATAKSSKPTPAPSTTHGGSSPRQYTAPGTQAQQAFISMVAPGAIAAQQRYGVPAAVTIAQAIEESAWGQSGLAAEYHNLFGIKGTGPAGSVTLPTSEFEGGGWVTIDAQFRVYHNDAESIADHAELLATSGYYTRAMADRAVPDAFANDLTGVYATDPNYGANLIALMKLYNLYQYDTASAPAAPTASAPRATTPATSPTTHAGSGSASGPAPATGRADAGSAGADSGTIPGISAPALAPVPDRTDTPASSSTHGTADGSIPGLISPSVAASGSARPTLATPAGHPTTGQATTGQATRGSTATGYLITGHLARGRVPAGAAWYEPRLPQAVVTSLFANAKGPLARGEHLYRDVAACTDISWKLLAAVDWMQCKADPRYSPVHGEKLGSLNDDGTSYTTKSAALTQCACDLVELSAAVYGIDLAARRPLSVRELAASFAAFRWGAILQRHGVSPMEFPYAVAGLTAAHQKMHWPSIATSDAPDRPGARFREPFGAVPVVLSLSYPATV